MNFFSQTYARYSPLPTDGDIKIERKKFPSSSSKAFNYRSRLCLLSLLLSISIIILSTATLLNSHIIPLTISLQSKTTIHDCGGNFVEAREKGCVFDIMSFTWLHPLCYDSELTSELRQLRDFRYFVDVNGTVEVPEAEVMLGEQSLYSSWEQHLHHCMYTWRKLHRAAMRGSPIDTYVGSYRHTVDCGMQLIEEQGLYELEELNTLIVVKYPACVEFTKL